MRLMMPARFIARTKINPLQTAIRWAWAVIGPDLSGGSADAPPQQANSRWIAVLCLTVATALLLVVAGHAAGRRGYEVAPLFFWSGVILLVVPITLRVAQPMLARGERLFLLFLLAEALFYCKVVYSPTGFIAFDEFLHGIAADDLITARRLFLSNPLLPIGPTYPGLEILAMAIVNLTGLPLFVAGMLLLAILKGTFIGALFLFFESITGSPRISAIACLTYMGCSTFVLFESMFSYESLGIVLCVLAFAVEAASKDLVRRPRLKALGLIALLLASLAVTHHLSAGFAAIYFGALAVLEALRRHGSLRTHARTVVGLTALLAIALPLLWVQVHGNTLTGYLGPSVETGFKTLIGKILGAPTPRSEHLGAPTQPVGMRLTTLLAILLLSLGLATGFFRSLAMAAPSGVQAGWRPMQDILRRNWRDSRIVLLTLLAFGFPVSVALRLTNAGWEIGNRMGTFVFIAVGLVVAVGIVHFWQGRTPRGWRRIAPAVALTVIVLGGVTTSSLNPIHGRYRVAADQESIEPMGIETARWTKEWLGAGNRFTADRINRLLLASYGRQDARIKIAEGIYSARIFEGEELGSDELYALARSDIDFLLVDLRLSTAPPVLGFYFEPWQPQAGTPISGAELLKFDDIQGVTRIYDNGWIVIYDIRGLHGNF
ncbi:putative transmembrane protein [Mesorhizobium sp. SOD10]|nr:putative transmembrane protein [Mesorhizobium sp. SOD10]